MPISECCGCPFGCDGLVSIDESLELGKCGVCGADVYSTTSKKRLKIIDNLFAAGAPSMEVSQVVDYCARKKTPKGDEGAVIFAVRKTVQ